MFKQIVTLLSVVLLVSSHRSQRQNKNKLTTKRRGYKIQKIQHRELISFVFKLKHVGYLFIKT